MKHLKNYLFALGCLAAAGLTSCLSDSDSDENTGISRQEISQCLAATKGNYTGKILFEVENSNDSNDHIDTLDIDWSVTTDTMVVINQFPQAAFLENIKDSTMKAALAAAEPAESKIMINFYQASPIVFLLYPFPIIYDIEYKGEPHKASLVFWYNTYYSFGQFDTSSRVFQMQLIMAALFLDEDTNRNYLLNSGSNTASLPIMITNANLSKNQ
ncbi:MAG: DUF4840 domain-containing protein [Prevotella sp.]|nr:DUF4840 domain-containing protein [Prevotella sp.]